jgi:hypothetical protein
VKRSHFVGSTASSNDVRTRPMAFRKLGQVKPRSAADSVIALGTDQARKAPEDSALLNSRTLWVG